MDFSLNASDSCKKGRWLNMTIQSFQVPYLSCRHFGLEIFLRSSLAEEWLALLMCWLGRNWPYQCWGRSFSIITWCSIRSGHWWEITGNDRKFQIDWKWRGLTGSDREWKKMVGNWQDIVIIIIIIYFPTHTLRYTVVLNIVQ